MKERALGAVMLLGGILLGYLCVYQPLASARRGDPKVSVSLKGQSSPPSASSACCT
jgi:hypothetical protein